MADDDFELKKLYEAATSEDIEVDSSPIEPPRWELFAQAVVRNKGDVRKSANEFLDPLIDPNVTKWIDVPYPVKRRIKWFLSMTAKQTIATRDEIAEMYTRIIRGDTSRKHEQTIPILEAAKELCKMQGYYSPVEIKNIHETVVPESIKRLSNDDLNRIISDAKKEAIDVEYEIKDGLGSIDADQDSAAADSALRSEKLVVQRQELPDLQGDGDGEI